MSSAYKNRTTTTSLATQISAANQISHFTEDRLLQCHHDRLLLRLRFLNKHFPGTEEKHLPTLGTSNTIGALLFLGLLVHLTLNPIGLHTE